MNRFISFAVCAVIAICSFFTAPQAQAAPKDQATQTSWISKIPVKLVIEQTATFADGKTVTVYYQKNGDICEVYSPDNLQGCTVNDLLNLQSTTFRIATAVKGKRVYYTTVAQARKLIKQAVNTYL